MLRFKFTTSGQDVIHNVCNILLDERFRYVTPEIFLLAMFKSPIFTSVVQDRTGDDTLLPRLRTILSDYISKTTPRKEDAMNSGVISTEWVLYMVEYMRKRRPRSTPKIFSLPLLFEALLSVEDDYIMEILDAALDNGDYLYFTQALYAACQKVDNVGSKERINYRGFFQESPKYWDFNDVVFDEDAKPQMIADLPKEPMFEVFSDEEDDADDNDKLFDPNVSRHLKNLFDDAMEQMEANMNDYDDDDINLSQEVDFSKYAIALGKRGHGQNPLIGREQEIERITQVLCRKEKNNVLLLGESGVGKTSIVHGFADMLSRGKIAAKRLSSHTIYQVDLGAMIAGTQYRGMFEERLKGTLNYLSDKGKSIVYFDEMHTLVGAGASNESPLDATSLIKPYLESGKLLFIGCTTYKDFNRFIERNQGLVRRFQQIDVQETTLEQTIEIIKGLKGMYERFHKVKYPANVVTFAVNASTKYLSNRYNPDKTIDLIDEAGAYCEIHSQQEGGKVTREIISTILTKMCKVDKLPEDTSEQSNGSLRDLYDRINAKIYGQDTAIRRVSEAVQMSQAGLQDDNKPIASLLFVGPTGVGKTEVAKVLASELSVPLVRFDMSEYAEKHTIAKLIGSPAGYVGYEDGGLLTDAIRKTPNCVLLLDEIEKAHSDIYNILLQVMDYASLTDNKGKKADFRHVILIMTSNAGAQFAHQASLGFNSQVKASDSMLKSVKQLFKPEFLNRLNAIVPFNDMDRNMEQLILKKKLSELHAKLSARKIKLTIQPEVEDMLLRRGFTREMGARELDRIISSRLKTVLMREILFGSLVNGGNATASLDAQDEVIITANSSKTKVKS